MRFDKPKKESHEKKGDDEIPEEIHQAAIKNERDDHKKDFFPANFFSHNVPQSLRRPFLLPGRLQNETQSPWLPG